MRKSLLVLLTLVITTLTIAQTPKNIFKTFEDFKPNKPSDYVEFRLKKRTGGNVFMTGGITNYRLKKISPKTKYEDLTKKTWGVLVNDSIYINSYPYSKIVGFNKIIENGYYSYFIGEPARLKDEQISLGMINSDEPQKLVCCKTSYVILPNGTVKWLSPELLATLIKDNKTLKSELKVDNIQQEDAYRMFDYLKRYNATKQ